MGAGRPTKYNPDMCDKIIELMAQGASIIEVSAEIGVCKDTVYEWSKPTNPCYHKEFSDALKKGIQLSEAWWEKAGRENLTNQKFSYTGWYMNMKNRFGWRDKMEHSGDADNPIQIISNIKPKKDEE